MSSPGFGSWWCERPACRIAMGLAVAWVLSGCLTEQQEAVRRLQEASVPLTRESAIAAARDGDLPLLRLLAAAEGPLYGADAMGRTPLMLVVSSSNLAATQLLLEGASAEDVNIRDRDGLSALSYAATGNQHAMVRLLLAAGASPDAPAGAGESLIAFAVRRNDVELVEELTSSAETRIPTAALAEPLYQSIASRNGKMASLLLAAGADPNFFSASESRSRSPLAAAVEADATELAQLLVEHGAGMLRVLPATGKPPSAPTAGAGAGAGARAGAEPGAGRASACDAQGGFLERHLLPLAARRQNLPVVQLLVAAGAPIDAAEGDPGGKSAVEIAAETGNAEMLFYLLEKSAAPGNALLEVLAKPEPSAEVVDRLLAAGGDLDGRDASGDSPLHIAFRNNDLALAAQLLGSEPDLEVPGRLGQSVLCLAVTARKLPFAKLLLEHGANPNAEFNEKPSDAFLETVGNRKFAFYLKRDRGLTALMLAAAYGDVALTQLLLEHGARRGKISKKWKRWPVNFACDEEHIACAQLLLGREADSSRDVSIHISLKRQRAFLYDDGKLVTSTNVSTGREGFATPTGTFVITDKRRHHVSNLYDSSMPYFQRLSCQAFGFHVGPCPGYPASHGCIRMPAEAARAFWKKTLVGDPVTISE